MRCAFPPTLADGPLMTTEKIVTACLLIIGNEILSGRTQDANLAYIAKGLGEVGVRLRETGTTLDNGTVFRILELQPDNIPRVHRTDSLDYAVIMSGEIDMELETGDITHLKAGDVVVQRGTVHNWINRGPEPCVIAFVLIAAKPVEVAGKVLPAFG